MKEKKQINKTTDLILNLTPENVTQHSRIVTTTRKGSSTPTKFTLGIPNTISRFPLKNLSEESLSRRGPQHAITAGVSPVLGGPHQMQASSGIRNFSRTFKPRCLLVRISTKSETIAEPFPDIEAWKVCLETRS